MVSTLSRSHPHHSLTSYGCRDDTHEETEACPDHYPPEDIKRLVCLAIRYCLAAVPPAATTLTAVVSITVHSVAEISHIAVVPRICRAAKFL